MPGHGHDGTRAVAHQHEIGDPQRYLVTRQRVNRGNTKGHALLLHRLERRLGGICLDALCNERCDVGIGPGRLGRQRMLRGDGHVGNTQQRIGPRRVDGQGLVLVLDVERQFHAFGAANPVALHCFDRVRPARHAIEFVEQLICIRRRLHEPLGNLPPLNQRVRTPAATVDNLLVRENGLVDRIPVHDRVFAVDQALFEHLREQPLFPAVVFGPAGRDFPRPVVTVAETVELATHLRNVLVRPFRRRHPVLDCRIFGRHAERIPSHRLEHVFALHAVISGNNVRDCEHANVPHVKLPARVREHREAVEFLLIRVFVDLEATGVGPVLLGLLLDNLRLVRRAHGAG